MATLLAVLPGLVSLVLAIFQLVQSGQAKGQAVNDIISQVLQRAVTDIQIASKAETDAEADHKAHPNDDGGFDPNFKRPD